MKHIKTVATAEERKSVKTKEFMRKHYVFMMNSNKVSELRRKEKLRNVAAKKYFKDDVTEHL